VESLRYGKEWRKFSEVTVIKISSFLGEFSAM
jgi:hypothetical protein